LGCLRFFAFVPGAGYVGSQYAGLLDLCNKGTDYSKDAIEAPLKVETLADGTGLMTITAPRSYSPLTAEGSVLTQPQANVRNLVGAGPQGDGQPLGQNPDDRWRGSPQIDNTTIGTDYALQSAVAPVPSTTPSAKPTPPVKKGCDKANGKKKGCGKGKGPKTPPPAACAAYVPGEQGAKAPMVTVTDANTKDAPLSGTITAAQGVGTASGTPVTDPLFGHSYVNVQVNSKAPSTGLYVRVEFPAGRDYDLYLNNADGTEVAHANGSNVVAATPAAKPLGADGTGAGGHSEVGAEQLDGVKTAGCSGYTIDLGTADGEGGDLKVSYWLGEATYDPATAPALLNAFNAVMAVF
jgi:hypothetical protein